jgi:predicted phage replisome organizer
VAFFIGGILSQIKWIKITTDIFNDEKIRVIENMPEGDTILVVWLKLLTLAGKVNDKGSVYLTPQIPYTPEMLQDIFNKDSRIISLAINTFISFGMIDLHDNGMYSISNWEKHQNVEGMDKIKEQTRKRVAKHRQQKKLEDCNATVTLRNATEEDIDIDIEEDKNKNKKESKNKYGEYKKVLLSQKEYEKLINEWGESELVRMIKILDEGIELKGYKYKNHNLAIRKWKDKENNNNTDNFKKGGVNFEI